MACVDEFIVSITVLPTYAGSMTEFFEQLLQRNAVHEAHFGQRFERRDRTSDAVHAVIQEDTHRQRISRQELRHRFVCVDDFRHARPSPWHHRGSGQERCLGARANSAVTRHASALWQVFGEGD